MSKTAELFSGDFPNADPGPRGKRRGRRSAEDDFAFQCKARGLPEPERELRFARSILSSKGRPRQWKFDFAFPHPYMVAVEIEGIVVTKALVNGKQRLVSMGRHAHAEGFREDCRKYASAAQLGWLLLRFDPKMVKSGEAIEYTMRVLSARGWTP